MNKGDILRTLQTNEWPEIYWTLGDIIKTYPQRLTVIREIVGSDIEGNQYTGSAYFFDDEYAFTWIYTKNLEPVLNHDNLNKIKNINEFEQIEGIETKEVPK